MYVPGPLTHAPAVQEDSVLNLPPDPNIMKATPLAIPDVLLIEPKVFGDERGCFLESFNQAECDRLLGRKVAFVQDNHSQSARNVLRGIHFQIRRPQGKLVRASETADFLYKASDCYSPAEGHVAAITRKCFE